MTRTYLESEEVEHIIGLVRGVPPSDTGWWRIECLFCANTDGGKADKKKSLGVSSETGKVSCFRCATEAFLPPEVMMAFDAEDMLIARLTGFDGFDELAIGTPREDGVDDRIARAPGRAVDDAGRRIIEPPDSFTLLGVNPGLTSRAYLQARIYMLGERNTTPEQWAAYDVGACLEGKDAFGRIVVPIYNAQGEWVGYSGRDFTKRSTLKYKYPSEMDRAKVMYWEHNLDIETDEPCLIVEGVFDCWPYPGDSVACLGSPTKWQIARMARARRPLCFVYDLDAWEKAEAMAMHFRLEGMRAGFVKLKDARDPDEVDPQELMEDARDSIEALL